MKLKEYFKKIWKIIANMAKTTLELLTEMPVKWWSSWHYKRLTKKYTTYDIEKSAQRVADHLAGQVEKFLSNYKGKHPPVIALAIDQDGTLSKLYSNPDKTVLEPGAAGVVNKWREAGISVLVITSRGYTSHVGIGNRCAEGDDPEQVRIFFEKTDVQALGRIESMINGVYFSERDPADTRDVYFDILERAGLRMYEDDLAVTGKTMLIRAAFRDYEIPLRLEFKGGEEPGKEGIICTVHYKELQDSMNDSDAIELENTLLNILNKYIREYNPANKNMKIRITPESQCYEMYPKGLQMKGKGYALKKYQERTKADFMIWFGDSLINDIKAMKTLDELKRKGTIYGGFTGFVVTKESVKKASRKLIDPYAYRERMFDYHTTIPMHDGYGAPVLVRALELALPRIQGALKEYNSSKA